MSDYCHRKVVRMKIFLEEACKIFNAEGGGNYDFLPYV